VVEAEREKIITYPENVLNLSISKGYFPDEMKIVNVVPLFP
jgi:hypothetical protein